MFKYSSADAGSCFTGSDFANVGLMPGRSSCQSLRPLAVSHSTCTDELSTSETNGPEGPLSSVHIGLCTDLHSGHGTQHMRAPHLMYQAALQCKERISACMSVVVEVMR